MAAAQRPRLLLLIPHLGGGGAERVTALLARGLSPAKYDVHLGLVTQAGMVTPVKLIPQENGDIEACEVRVHALGARRVRGGAVRLLRLIRWLKPDVILSGMAHLNFMVLLLRPFFRAGTCVLIRQNSTASAALDFGGLPVYTRALYRLLYGRADRVICQTEAMARDLSTEFGVRRERLAVLASPLDISAIRARVNEPAAPVNWPEAGSNGPHLLAVGRLSREKGFDWLLDAFAIVRKRFAHANLAIVGAGLEEGSLKTQCHALGLDGAVHFAGYVEDPAAWFAGASAFVLCSRYEGLPNALLEAAAAGLPIFALPSSEGVVELLRGQQGVWLAGELSAGALAETMIEALSALRPRERFAHEFVEQFDLRRACAAYEDLIDSVLINEDLREARG